MNCWICYEPCSRNKYCKCQNEFSYCHSTCLHKWCIESNSQYCRFCKTQYDIPMHIKFINYLYIIFNAIVFFFNDIGEYNIYTGLRWDDH
ncbi:hypothetical protein CPAV1605_1122 [seawater metagenome]|uniref:RING-CH-type domain-containing protein n=1 Tax=seawater metagenome TaxID=1561972 RepID=A0A5E8CJC2_9ZZZZ